MLTDDEWGVCTCGKVMSLVLIWRGDDFQWHHNYECLECGRKVVFVEEDENAQSTGD